MALTYLEDFSVRERYKTEKFVPEAQGVGSED